MADNVAVTPGTGATIATDDVGGVQYQRVKLDLGGDGLSSPLLRGQQTKANSLPVALASDQDAIPVTDNGAALSVDDGGASLTVDNATLESLVQTEDAPHTTGDKGVLALAVRNDSGGVFGADGDYCPLSLDGSGALRVVSITGGAVSGSAAHDAAASGNPVLLGGYASAAAPADVSADGDAARLWVLRNGAQAAVLTAAGALIGGDAANGLDVDVTRLPALPAGSNAIGTITAANTAGDVAHDGADSGNPVKIGARARGTDIAAVASDDRTDLIADLTGKLIVNPYAIPENSLHGATAAITNTSDTAVIAAQGVGIRVYVTELLVTNSHATVGTVVEIKDGTTVIHRGFAAPNGGGFALDFPKPLRLTANTALNAANTTTGSNTYVSASGYKAP